MFLELNFSQTRGELGEFFSLVVSKIGISCYLLFFRYHYPQVSARIYQRGLLIVDTSSEGRTVTLCSSDLLVRMLKFKSSLLFA